MSRDPNALPADEAAEPDLTVEQVVAFLARHPQFLAENPDLLTQAALPGRALGDGVVDMQRYLLERLRGEIDNLRTCAVDLIETIRTNMANQTRTHNATFALLGSGTVDQLARTVAEQLPLILDLDVATICFEHPASPDPRLVGADLRRLPEGAVDRLVGADRRIRLIPTASDDGTVFGGGGALVRSAALARIGPGIALPHGMLALGSRVERAFHAGQGTDLVAFLARIVEWRLQELLSRPD